MAERETRTMRQFYWEKNNERNYRVYDTKLSGSRGECLGEYETAEEAIARVDSLNEQHMFSDT
jgi:hypothetical protein